jgi:YVTN family beta-propeller protein
MAPIIKPGRTDRPARERDLMRPIQRALILTAVVIAGFTPAASTTAAAAFPVTTAAHPAGSCGVEATIRVGRDPRGVAVDPRTKTVYVANVQSGTVSLISARTNTVTATIPAGISFPFGIAADPKVKAIYVTSPTVPGRAAAISVKTRTVVARIRVGGIPLFLAANSKTASVYVANSSDNTLSVISGRTNTVTATIPVGIFPNGVAANPKTNTIYVANAISGTVSVISGKTNTVTTTIPVGREPEGVAVNPKTDTIFVADFAGEMVLVISGKTNTVTATIPVGTTPAEIAVNPQTNTAYVTENLSNTVAAISCPR